MPEPKLNKKIIFFVVSTLLIYIFISIFSGSAHGQERSATIVALGDSVTLGTGATSGQGYVNVLERRIGQPIINAGVSGDTTASALARLDRDVISRNPDVVIVFLGGNDILRGVSNGVMFENLRLIIERIQDSGAEVVLVGVHGSVFLSDLEDDYRNLALSTGAHYVPGAFVGILGNPLLMSDLVHPNNAGHELIAERILPVLQDALRDVPGQALTVVCEADRETAFVGQSVRWSLSVTGGEGNYRYIWVGADGLVSSSSSITKTYETVGTKNAEVSVTSGNETRNISCPSVNVVPPVVVGGCSVTASYDTSRGYRVRWSTDVQSFGVSTTTNYEWSPSGGDSIDNTDNNQQSIERVYTQGGLKIATVRAGVGSESLTLVCSVDLPDFDPNENVENSNDNIGGSCLASVSGMKVYWSASQYGGRNDNDFDNYNDDRFLWSGTDGLSATSSNFEWIYTKEGVKRASVVMGEGGEQITFNCEAKVAKVPENVSGCFIATAAFGTDMESEVVVLRKFRDQKLLTNSLGKKFVALYYKTSPPVADFIRERSNLRALVRASLKPLIFVSRLTVGG